MLVWFFLLGAVVGRLSTIVAYRFGTLPVKPLPVIELVMAILFALSHRTHYNSFYELLLSLLLVTMCTICTLTDIFYTRIPNRVLICFLPLFAGLRFFLHPELWTGYLFAGVVGFLLFFATAVYKPGALGMGDVKLAGLLGFILGWKGLLVCLLLSSLVTLLVGLYLMIMRKAGQQTAIPYAPALSVGAIAAWFNDSTVLECLW